MVNIYESVTRYLEARSKLSGIIAKTNYSPQQLAAELGISKSRFYERLRHSEWEPEHVQKIALLLRDTPGITIGGTEAV